jgi:aryl-alcohol dehydrogenase-like predicted oxidoreductase
MKYRLLGRTGVFVSELSLGTMAYGGANPFWKNIGDLDVAGAASQIALAIDAGVNLIDTADYYSNGASEEIVGAALDKLGAPRADVIIATKCRLRMGSDANAVGLSRRHVIAAAEASLKRLRTDHIDLYQLHGFDPLTPIDETLRALDDLVRAGKVRYIGLCNFPAWRIMQALGVSERMHLARFETAQMYYSAVGRDIETDVIPLCREQRMSVMAWSPLAGGYLSGKYRNADATGRRASFDFPPVNGKSGAKALAAIDRIARKRGTSAAQVSLAWLLAKEIVATVIVGARTDAQLKDNLAATDLLLSPSEIAQIDAAAPPASAYPAWMVDRQSGDRQVGGGAISQLPKPKS